MAFTATELGLVVATNPRSVIPVVLACAAKYTNPTARTAAGVPHVTGTDLVLPDGVGH